MFCSIVLIRRIATTIQVEMFDSYHWENVGIKVASIQFYLLLSPYLCFISFLYFGFYVLGDNSFIR